MSHVVSPSRSSRSAHAGSRSARAPAALERGFAGTSITSCASAPSHKALTLSLSLRLAQMASALEELVERIKTRATPDAYCVFDLDRTLWSGDCQKFSKPQELKLYPDVPLIFEALRSCGIPWAVASANPSRQRCLWLLQAHGLLAPGQGFAGIGARLEPGAEIAAEIFPGGKKPHLERICRAVGRPWACMLFFDDLSWNVQQAEKLGAVGVRVEAGLTVEALLSGLERQRAHQQSVGSQQSSMKRWLNGAPQPAPKRGGADGAGGAGGAGGIGGAAAPPQRRPGQVSHEAALATLQAVTGNRCDTATLEALLARHGGDPAAAAAAFFDDPRLEPAAARRL